MPKTRMEECVDQIEKSLHGMEALFATLKLDKDQRLSTFKVEQE